MNELPEIDLALSPEDEPFFAALSRGSLAVPWCVHCDDHVWPARSHCVQCYRPVGELRTLPGTGEVYSFSVVHRGEGPFARAVPYVFALVALDGGPTIMANVVVDEPDDVAVGRRVRLVDRTPSTGGTSVVGAQFRLV